MYISGETAINIEYAYYVPIRLFLSIKKKYVFSQLRHSASGSDQITQI